MGRSDPHYGPALEAVSKASAAVGGTNPISGQPYAPGYAGLPTELTELQKRLVVDYEETREVSLLAGRSTINHAKNTASVASYTTAARSSRAETSSPSAPSASAAVASTVARTTRGTVPRRSPAGVSSSAGGADRPGRKPELGLPALRTPAVAA